MQKLTAFSLIGFFAQLMDGALGMGFGLSSSTILLSYGLAPAVASASIHMSQIATTAASGFSHYKFGNIDRSLVLTIAVPGAVSAFLGAAALTYISGEHVRPYLSFLLLALGIYIVIRFLFLSHKEPKKPSQTPLNKRFLFPLGFVGGFLDSVGGGGWGPVNTPVLLTRSGIVPRKVIGTVDTSEFLVTISATAGFLIFLGGKHFSWMLVLAFIVGGVIAAPLAAWLVKNLPSTILGVMAGGFIILTNLRTLLTPIQMSNVTMSIIYISLVCGYLYLVIYSIRNHLKVKMIQEQA